jgi:hypothetical protein
LGSGFGAFQDAYAASVYITDPTLGLNNALVTSPTYLYFGNGVVGFTDTTTQSFGTILTAFNTNGVAPFTFGTYYNLATLSAPQGPVAVTGTELRTADRITFANGSYIGTGLGLGLSNQSNSISVETTTPLPAALPLFASGLAGLGLLGWRRKRKAVAWTKPTA